MLMIRSREDIIDIVKNRSDLLNDKRHLFILF